MRTAAARAITIVLLLLGATVVPLERAAAADLGITTAGIPNGLAGKAYAATLTANGGKSGYKWSVASGSLPTGITLSSTGKLAGTPSAPGSSTVTIQVTDSSTPTKQTATKSFTVDVDPVTVNALTLPTGIIGKAYPSTKFTATGGKTTLVWTVSAGTLPAGLKLSTAGALSGTPSAPGTSSFTVQVADGSKPKNIATREFTITVDPVTVVSFVPPTGLVGKAYPTTKFTATGGKATLVWTVSAGTLPAGLKLSTAGALSGTPTAAGTTTFTVQVADNSVPKNIATRQFTITIAPMTIATLSLPSGTVGKTFTTTSLKTNGGKETLSWTVVSSVLPPGLKLATNGSLSGKPTAAGTYIFRVQVADSSSPKNLVTRQFRVVVVNVGDAPTCDNFTGNTPDGIAYTCSFKDEFDGTTLDPTKWLAQTNFISGDKDHYACYSPNNISVSGGYLNLVVRQETTPIPCEATRIENTNVAPYSLFSAGSIATDRRFAQQYGRFEARVKSPPANTGGLQEAFWMVPDWTYFDANNPSTYAPWPYSGEIDISETYSTYPDLSVPYLHHGFAPPQLSDTATNCTAHRGVFNTYTLEWTPTKIQIDVNGQTCLVNTTSAANDPAFRKPYILVMSSLLGADDRRTNHNQWTPATPLPATTQVDYIRAWTALPN